MNRDRESPMEDDSLDMDTPTVTLTDEAGLQLTCYIEHSLDVDEQEYVLLLPVDSPIEIFAWEENGDEDEAVLVEDQDTLDQVFPIAKAVLEEQNLSLKRTAVVLTVEGELPDLDEDEEWAGVE